MAQHSKPRASGGDEPPKTFPETTPPASYEPSHIVQMLVEIQRDLGGLKAKADRLIDDVGKLDDRVDAVRQKITRAEGLLAGAVFMIVVAFGLGWWLMGGKINDIRDQILQTRPEAVEQQKDVAE